MQLNQEEVRQRTANSLAQFAVVEDVTDGWTVEARIVQHLFHLNAGCQSAAMLAIRFYGGSSKHIVDMIEKRCTVLIQQKIITIEPSMSAVLYRLHADFRAQCEAINEARHRLEKGGFIKPH